MEKNLVAMHVMVSPPLVSWQVLLRQFKRSRQEVAVVAAARKEARVPGED
jgi:hypothetical protein